MSVYHGIILVVLNIIISAVLLTDVKLELVPIKVVPWLKISTIINSNTLNETYIDVLISYIFPSGIFSKKVVMLIILSVLIKT